MSRSSTQIRAAKTAAAGTAIAGTLMAVIIAAIFIAPVIVMLGTDYLHNFVPAVPELGFVPSVVACVTTRALLGTRDNSAKADA